MCCTELLGTKANSGQVAAALCTASCKACPPLVQVVPAIAIPIASNSDHWLQQFKDISIAVSTPGPFGPGYRV